MIADALSRQVEIKNLTGVVEITALTGLSAPLPCYVEDIHLSTMQDTGYKELWNSLKQGTCSKKYFSLQ